MEKPRALIAMSGGVDSSAAAALMCSRGYECVGVTMKLYDAEQTDSSRLKACCTLEDAEDARSVAYRLGMQYYVFNFKEDFREQVIGRFVDAYERGETPNPCIDCNRYMKFEKLYQRARVLGYDTIVTGHYARIAYDETSGRWLLKKGRNAAKDQSYVLYAMTQEELAHTQFPLGEFESKDEVRKLAASYGFINAEKHDSQDICFVPDGDYAAFIERYTGKQYPHGNFIDEFGRVLGEHQGLIRYTIGQRRGLGIAAGKPVYVCRKSVADNTVTLSDSASLFSTRLTARDFNWIAFAQPPEHPIRVAAKPRYRAKEAPATAEAHPDGTVTITFDQPQRAITAGQAVVLYDGDTVIGGGTICQ